MKKILLISIFLNAAFCTAQLKYEISPLGINTKHFNEFAAYPYRDGIVFCSNDKKEFSWLDYSNAAGENFTAMYFSRKENGRWSKPELFSKELQTALFNGPAAFSKNNSRIFYSHNLTAGRKLKNNPEKNALGIFYAEKQEDQWSAAVPFAHNSGTHSVSHPSLSADGMELYFTSDAPGGFGGTDIYVCELKGNSWSAPVNLGAAVNTAGNEMFPFIHSGGKLYFSSNGHHSAGGLDILFVERTKEGWSNALPLPSPLNSAYDDFAYVSGESEREGYFSSNRAGTDDIYEFRDPWPLFEKCDSLKLSTRCFEFFQEGDDLKQDLPLAYEWVLGDGTRLVGKEVEHCYKKPGLYHVELNVIDKETGNVFYSEASYDVEVIDAVQPYISSMDTVPLSMAAKLDALSSNLPGFGSGSYYWDFGDGAKDTGRVVNHLFASLGVFPVALGAVSEDGSRKACVTKFIVVSAAPGSSEKHKSITVTSPEKSEEKVLYSVEVASAEQPIPVNDAGFDKLQKEYVLRESFIPETKRYSYTVGEEKTLSDVYPIYKDVKKMGYDKAVVKSYLDNIISLDEALLIEKEELRSKVIRLLSTHFASGSHQLNAVAREEADKLFRLMQKDEKIRVHIAAHTDDEGEEDANMKLSMQRAGSIMDYLVKKGIDKSRMSAEGFGESRPLAPNLTEKEKEQNRRVEIFIKY